MGMVGMAGHGVLQFWGEGQVVLLGASFGRHLARRAAYRERRHRSDSCSSKVLLQLVSQKYHDSRKLL